MSATPDQFRPAQTPMLLVGWVAMVFGMFMAVLDIQIVASSLAEIQAGMSASVDEVRWVQTGYLVAEIIMIPFSGFLARLLSARRMFLYTATGFTLASLACSFSWSLESLVFFRVVQGFIGGGMIPTAFASVYRVFPPERQIGANVILGLIVTMAPASGPTLGGYITEVLSWEWVFLINVVPGAIIVFLVSMMPDIDQPQPELRKSFDGVSLVAMAFFLGGLQYVLDEGPKDEWFESRSIVFWAVISATASLIFFWRSFTAKSPLINLRIFRNRSFAGGCLAGFAMGIGLFGGIYTIPQFLAHVKHYNALQIGEALSVGGVAMLLTAPVVGRLAARFDMRLVLAAGMVITSTSFFLVSHMTADTSIHELALPLILRGIGMISMIVSINTLSMGSLPLQDLSNGSALFNLLRNLGGAIGLAMISTLLDIRNTFHRQHLSEWINPARPEYQSFIADMKLQGLSDGAVQDLLVSNLVNQQAYIMAFNDTHFGMGLLYIFSLLFVFVVAKPVKADVASH